MRYNARLVFACLVASLIVVIQHVDKNENNPIRGPKIRRGSDWRIWRYAATAEGKPERLRRFLITREIK